MNGYVLPTVTLQIIVSVALGLMDFKAWLTRSFIKKNSYCMQFWNQAMSLTVHEFAEINYITSGLGTRVYVNIRQSLYCHVHVTY